MESVIITAYKEPKTIKQAIISVAKQLSNKSEILVTAPDEETLNAARSLEKQFKNLRMIKDLGNGKPAALNLAVSKAKGNILILTDGDVFISDKAIKHLIEPFAKSKIGAVSGNPVSINSKNNKHGYWAHVLTKIADERRKTAVSKNRRFFCSGYLFAIRKELFPKLPENLLSEDGFISHQVYGKGYRIAYAEEAKVFVKYPTNFKDWIIQKKRSAGGYNQIRKMVNIEIRSFRKESSGSLGFLKYLHSFTESIWLVNLFLARVYLWLVIYRDINFKDKKREELWKRVESTK